MNSRNIRSALSSMQLRVRRGMSQAISINEEQSARPESQFADGTP